MIATILFCAYPLGEIVLGTVAWNVLSWRRLLQCLYWPGLLSVVYFWISPESVRWLLSKSRHQEVEKMIQNAAKDNGVTLSDKALCAMQSNAVSISVGVKLLFSEPEKFVHTCFFYQFLIKF